MELEMNDATSFAYPFETSACGTKLDEFWNSFTWVLAQKWQFRRTWKMERC